MKISSNKLTTVTKNLAVIYHKLTLWRYPYLHKLKWKNYIALFNINNPVEEFRIRKWGGEKEYVEKVMQSLKEDDVFYDVGASIGLFSVLASKILKRGFVVSFEPDPENMLVLVENFKLNKVENFRVISSAVGDGKKVMKLYTHGAGAKSPSLKPIQGFGDFIKVEVDSVDNLLRSRKLPKPSIVKIDVEGAEYQVLKGMSKLLSTKNCPAKIFLEIHPKFLPAFGASKKKIIDFLAHRNYKVNTKVEREDQILYSLSKKNT